MPTEPEADQTVAQTRRRRASPMSPDERRQAIISATVPLVREHGFNVSTRQIAEAAQIAEGTIFRVFEDKETLLHHAIHAALDPSDAEQTLRGIDAAAPLAERVRQAAGLLQQRMTDVLGLATAIGRVSFPMEDSQERRAQYERLTGLLAGVFEPDRDQLRCAPADAARLLQIVAFGGSHPRLAMGRTMTPEEIADLVLNGIRVHDEHPGEQAEQAEQAEQVADDVLRHLVDDASTPADGPGP